MREYRYMVLEDIERAEEVMHELAVSEVARGIVPSTETDYGFLEIYRMIDGDPDELHEIMATDTQTWAERRHNFIRRHRAQGEQSQLKTGLDPWWRGGQPTRRHLGLMAWAYTLTPDRTDRWLDSLERDNLRRNPAPGYQSWRWIQQDWRMVIPKLDGSVDFSKKCGEGSMRTRSGRPYLCLPVFVIRSLRQSRKGREVLLAQARKKIYGKGSKKRIPWHPMIKERWKRLEAATEDDDPKLGEAKRRRTRRKK